MRTVYDPSARDSIRKCPVLSELLTRPDSDPARITTTMTFTNPRPEASFTIPVTEERASHSSDGIGNIGNCADVAEETAATPDIVAPAKRDTRRPMARRSAGQFSVRMVPSACRYVFRKQRLSLSASHRGQVINILIARLQWRTWSVPGMLFQSAEQGDPMATRSSILPLYTITFLGARR